MPKIRYKDSFSIKLLKAIAVGGSLVLAASSPSFGIRAVAAFRKDLERKQWREFYRALYKLKRSKRINVTLKPDGSYNVEITNLGKKLVSRYNLDELIIKKPKQWDGFWRFFTFDIPGKKKQARWALLGKLKELGFVMAQKSIWVHPFECREELAVISKAFEVEPYVHFFVAHDLDKDYFLRRKFTRQTGIKLSDS